jgi:hypothetical protein
MKIFLACSAAMEKSGEQCTVDFALIVTGRLVSVCVWGGGGWQPKPPSTHPPPSHLQRRQCIVLRIHTWWQPSLQVVILGSGVA